VTLRAAGTSGHYALPKLRAEEFICVLFILDVPLFHTSLSAYSAFRVWPAEQRQHVSGWTSESRVYLQFQRFSNNLLWDALPSQTGSLQASQKIPYRYSGSCITSHRIEHAPLLTVGRKLNEWSKRFAILNFAFILL
jgi:hypothetical protein